MEERYDPMEWKYDPMEESYDPMEWKYDPMECKWRLDCIFIQTDATPYTTRANFRTFKVSVGVFFFLA